MTEETQDEVNSPSHYTAYKGIEIIELTEQMNFNRGNAVKYIARAGLKDPEKEIQDLEKAVWYINREITRLTPVDDSFNAQVERMKDRMAHLNTNIVFDHEVRIQDPLSLTGTSWDITDPKVEYRSGDYVVSEVLFSRDLSFTESRDVRLTLVRDDDFYTYTLEMRLEDFVSGMLAGHINRRLGTWSDESK